MTDTTPPGTLVDLLASGAPSHPAIVAPGGPVITYDSLRRQVRTLAQQLRAMGIGRGDRVAIVLPNGIEAIVTFLAVAAAGTAAPLNPAYKPAEFRFYIDDTNAKALITADAGGEEARGAAPSVDNRHPGSPRPRRQRGPHRAWSRQTRGMRRGRTVARRRGPRAPHQRHHQPS